MVRVRVVEPGDEHLLDPGHGHELRDPSRQLIDPLRQAAGRMAERQDLPRVDGQALRRQPELGLADRREVLRIDRGARM